MPLPEAVARAGQDLEPGQGPRPQTWYCMTCFPTSASRSAGSTLFSLTPLGTAIFFPLSSFTTLTFSRLRRTTAAFPGGQQGHSQGGWWGTGSGGLQEAMTPLPDQRPPFFSQTEGRTRAFRKGQSTATDQHTRPLPPGTPSNFSV